MKLQSLPLASTFLSDQQKSWKSGITPYADPSNPQDEEATALRKTKPAGRDRRSKNTTQAVNRLFKGGKTIVHKVFGSSKVTETAAPRKPSATKFKESKSTGGNKISPAVHRVEEPSRGERHEQFANENGRRRPSVSRHGTNTFNSSIKRPTSLNTGSYPEEK